MPANRLKYDSGFAPVPYNAMRDRRLSIEARGLFALLITHASDWRFNRRDIIEKCQCGDGKYDRMRKELVKNGYLEINRIRSASAKFLGYEWVIHDSPEGQLLEKSRTRKHRISQNTDTDKPADISIDNNKDKQVKGKNYKDTAFVIKSRINVKQFLGFKEEFLPDGYFIPETVRNYVDEKLSFSEDNLDTCLYYFVEFWMKLKNQEHGKKTRDEWISEMINWLTRNARQYGHI